VNTPCSLTCGFRVVSGIGNVWVPMGVATLAPECTYIGPRASQEYFDLTNCFNTPIERFALNACLSWDETCMQTELMTGVLDSGVATPISRVTIGSLQDIGAESKKRVQKPMTHRRTQCPYTAVELFALHRSCGLMQVIKWTFPRPTLLPLIQIVSASHSTLTKGATASRTLPTKSMTMETRQLIGALAKPAKPPPRKRALPIWTSSAINTRRPGPWPRLKTAIRLVPHGSMLVTKPVSVMYQDDDGEIYSVVVRRPVN
jgi:hypothetical protein